MLRDMLAAAASPVIQNSIILKVWWQDAILFVYFDFITYIHSFNHNTFIRRNHFLIACVLSGENLPVMPSRTITEPRRTIK
jgi:hypothetical protein